MSCRRKKRCSQAGARLRPWLPHLEKSHSPGEWPSDAGGLGAMEGPRGSSGPGVWSRARLAPIFLARLAGEGGERELRQHRGLALPSQIANRRTVVLPGTRGPLSGRRWCWEGQAEGLVRTARRAVCPIVLHRLLRGPLAREMFLLSVLAMVNVR